MALKRVEGINDADISYETGRGVVNFDPQKTSPDEFIAELTRLTGFTAEVMMDGADSTDELTTAPQVSERRQ